MQLIVFRTRCDTANKMRLCIEWTKSEIPIVDDATTPYSRETWLEYWTATCTIVVCFVTRLSLHGISFEEQARSNSDVNERNDPVTKAIGCASHVTTRISNGQGYCFCERLVKSITDLLQRNAFSYVSSKT